MVIDGKIIAAQKLEILRNKIQETKIKPKLAVILVGSDPASVMYTKLKKKKAEGVGVATLIVESESTINEGELRKKILELNRNVSVSGIIVQLPLPAGLDAKKVLAAIDPVKDVDGLTGRGEFLPATVSGILTILGEVLGSRDQFSGKIATVIGQGQLIGEPLAMELEKMGMTVNRCDEFTPHGSLREQSKKADILVSATGVINLVKADWVKPGAVVIDCGSPQPEVDFENVLETAGWITPVPGGVGPLTVASLLENTVETAYNNGIKHG